MIAENSKSRLIKVSTHEIQALIEGHKTQVRQVVGDGLLQKYKGTAYQDFFIATILEDEKPKIGEIIRVNEESNIILEVTNVRLESLQDISEKDAIAEGIDWEIFNGNVLFFDYLQKEYSISSPVISFRSLWVKINGEKSWEKNPFVWVYDFKLITK